MTTVLAAEFLASTDMSLRRPTITAQSSSYAAVASGQARSLPLNPHPAAAMNNSLHHDPQPQRPIVPSYLLESAYADTLLNSRTPTSAPGSSSSEGSPYGRASHNSENIESRTRQQLNLLPSRWSDTDKSPNAELLCHGSEVRLFGPPKVDVPADHASAVRANRSIPPSCGVFYYETTIVDVGKEGSIAVGFCTEKASLHKLPGWEADSWGYHSDDGHAFCCAGKRAKIGSKFQKEDIIGCGINFRDGAIFYTRNGNFLGVACSHQTSRLNKPIYPMVGLKKTGEHIRVNFGQQGFFFDIDTYMKEQKQKTYDEFDSQSITQLCPPLDETTLIQALASQYLSHNGYIETAKAFAHDVSNESRMLGNPNTNLGIKSLDPKGDSDAVNRHRIRRAVLDGDIDRAIELTNIHYPSVLNDDLLHFRLKRRKLVEMIRECADQGNNNKSSGAGMMDIDSWPEEPPEDVKNALDQAVEYGQQLREQFKCDNRPEIKRPLEEAFSLLAYTDPRNSVLAHLLDDKGRIKDGEVLNSAILVSLGLSPFAALERVVKHSSVIVQDLSANGGPGAFVSLKNDFFKD